MIGLIYHGMTFSVICLLCNMKCVICVYRWAAVGWPQKISIQIKKTVSQHLEEEERFHKILQSEQNNFEEQIDSLQVNLNFWFISDYRGEHLAQQFDIALLILCL